jgi:hypothetical protein
METIADRLARTLRKLAATNPEHFAPPDVEAFLATDPSVDDVLAFLHEHADVMDAEIAELVKGGVEPGAAADPSGGQLQEPDHGPRLRL